MLERYRSYYHGCLYVVLSHLYALRKEHSQVAPSIIRYTSHIITLTFTPLIAYTRERAIVSVGAMTELTEEENLHSSRDCLFTLLTASIVEGPIQAH
jgi:hypothetical protein